MDPKALNQIRVGLGHLLSLAGGGVGYPGFPTWDPGVNPDPGPEVIPGGGHMDTPVPEPSDVKYVGTVASLPAIASGAGGGGTEVKFNRDGIIIPQPGAVGAFWSRALQARWASIQPGRPIAYTQEGGFLVARDSSVQSAGNLALEFYAKPDHMSLRHFYQRVRDWTAQSGEGGAGAVVQALGGFFPGSASDVTLGTFTQTGATPQQIFLLGSNMPVGGASKAGLLIVSTPAGNTDQVFVGETSALAAASNNPLGAMGQDQWNIPSGGKAFFLSASGTQTLSARFRS